MGHAGLEDRCSQLLPGQDGEPALASVEGCLTYAALRRAVSRVAGDLHDLGVGAGEPVLVQCPDGCEHVIAVFATIAMGAVAVPVAADAPAGRLEHVARTTRARVCLGAEDQPAPAGLCRVGLRVSPSDGAVHLRTAPRGDGLVPHEHIAAAGDGVCLVRFSSGSTGVPKGAMLRLDQVTGMAAMLATHYGLDDAHRELVLAPLAYSGAWQRVAATLRGGGCVVFSGGGPRPVQAVLEDLASQALSGFFTPPPLLRLMLSLPENRVRAALAGCRSIEIGSGPLLAEELARLTSLAPDARIFFHYGLTECSRAFILEAHEHPQKLHTVGRASPGVEASIRDDAGGEVATGEVGEIFLRGPQQAIGYWGHPELERRMFVDGWLATGDHGALDEDGFLSFRGRADDRICCGGHSFYPVEVEEALGPIEGVAQYMLAGAPDRLLGEVVWAFVVPHGSGWSESAFMQTARRRLPSHMAPRRVVTVSALALTASGKLDRRGAVNQHVLEVTRPT